MENLKKNNEDQLKHLINIKSALIALGLILGISNFSYSQENIGRRGEKMEQIDESKEKSIETYISEVQNRNKRISKTNETLEVFTTRQGKKFSYEVENNGNISYKIDELRNILNNKFSQNIKKDEPVITIQAALKFLENTGKYPGLSYYTNKFSNHFDINFIDAIGYVQYINDLPYTGLLYGTNGEETLNKIIFDLNIGGNTEKPITNPEIGRSDFQPNKINKEQGQPVIKNQIDEKPVNIEQVYEEPVNQGEKVVNITHETGINNIDSDYSNMVKDRDKRIQRTNETLERFTERMHKKFLYEIDDQNNLLSKKIGYIKDILSSKFDIKPSSDPVIVIESALKELSKTEKYNGLQTYVNKFSGKFDLNFVNAYGFVQYMNDWDCNWGLYGKNGAIILQSIYDDLNDIGNVNVIINEKDNPSSTINTPRFEDNNLNEVINIPHNEDHDKVKENPTQNPSINPNDNEEIDINKTPDIETDTKNMEGISLLSHNLSPDKLDGVTYEDVWNTIDGFKHEGLKNAVIECLLRNDVIGAQKLLGMDINCDRKMYPNYVASRKLGKRELNLMEKYGQTRRLMDKDEILSFMEKIERAYDIENYEVKTAYLKFLSGEFDNGGLPYCITSKYDYKVYLFSADHKLLACQRVLTGAHVGDHPNDPKNGYHTTPGGMYEIGGFFDKNSEGKDLIAIYGTEYILFLPLENQYVYSEDYTMGGHGNVKGRERRFLSSNSKDSRCSNGCENFFRDTFGEIRNHLKPGSKFYICRDDE